MPEQNKRQVGAVLREDLHAHRQKALAEKAKNLTAKQKLEQEFWTVRLPTPSGLLDAAYSIFNLVAKPWAWLDEELRQKRFFAAVEARDAEKVLVEIKAGADIHAERDRAFLTAVFHNDVAVARQLFIQGVDPDVHHGLPLVLATIKGHADMVRCLLEEMDAHVDTSVFLDPGMYEHNPGSELVALLTPSFSFNHENPVGKILQEKGVALQSGSSFLGAFSFHGVLRASVIELRHGKVVFEDGKTFYLDSARQEAADAATAHFRKRRLIPVNNMRPQSR